MLIEAAKGGHTNVVSYLLDYPNNILSVPAPDLSQLTPPSQDASQVSKRKTFYKLFDLYDYVKCRDMNA